VRFYGYHGAAEHEREVGQWFSADIVDYRDAARRVVQVGGGEPAQLRERAPDRLAEACRRAFAIEAARVRLRQFSSPAPGVPGTTWIEIFRTRSAA
jgi:dihydroneopterin aldolase